MTRTTEIALPDPMRRMMALVARMGDAAAVSAEDAADAGRRCEACRDRQACAIWLDRQHRGALPPAFCPNGRFMAALRVFRPPWRVAEDVEDRR
jgi:hypothetical protein